MNAERLLRYYERVADAPNAMEQFRRFALDLAVRGKLVVQEPTDEPASALLARISSEKARVPKRGQSRNAHTVSGLSGSDRNFLCPPGWALTYLHSICLSVTDGDHLPPPKAETGIPFLVIGDVRSQEIDFAGCRYVSAAYYNKLDEIRRPRRGDLLYTLVGSFGIPVVVRNDQPFCVQRHIGILRPSASISVEYLALAMESRYAFDQAVARATGIAQKTVSLAGLRRMRLPLPPLAEQHRIVAKLDELMALCDRLEAARADREVARDQLASASLARLNAPDPETFADDARFALDALQAITARPDQIKQLRQTILNLAVRGTLVHQERGAAKAISNKSPDASALVALPIGWQYERLNSLLAEDTRNGYSRRPDDAADGTPILRISAGTVRRDGVVAEEEHKLISGIDSAAREQYSVRTGDLLACRFNGNKAFVGRLTIFIDYLGVRPIYPDKLIRIRVAAKRVLPEYLRLSGDSDLVRSQIEAFCATTVGNWGISATNLKEVQFPIPPLAEQHLIVAKVKELMSLCDQLESSLKATAEHRSRLLEALLRNALESGDHDESTAPGDEAIAA